VSDLFIEYHIIEFRFDTPSNYITIVLNINALEGKPIFVKDSAQNLIRLDINVVFIE